MKRCFLSFAFILFALASTAQTSTKVAYIFEDYVFENYEKVKKLNEDIKIKQEGFQTEFNKLALEYQQANADYQNSMKDITNATSESLNGKIKKVQEVREAAENYQRESEKSLQEFIGQNITVIKDEILVATNKVSKSKALTYIFKRNKADNPMTPGRVVLFVDEAKTLNVSDDVLKILNAAK